MPAANDQHYEWFNLIEIAGPFLAIPVLQQVFPQGLDGLVTNDRQRLRQAYEEWVEVVENKESDLLGIHREWILMVMKDALEYGEELKLDASELNEPLEMRAIGRENKPAILVTAYAPGTNLLKPVPGSLSVESPEEIMRARCKTEEVRIGIVTNGEEWMLVNAPVGKTSGYAMWHARIWWQEPVTLKAFSSLLNIRRAFGPPEETMDQLLERSTEFHEEVTDTLGEQVRHAVEVLVRALGRADQDRNGELLKDVDPKQLYEAGLTVMMRLVFTLCAEERELLLLGDPVYDQNYALSNLRAQLREDSDQHGPEVLEKRFDAWSRLLSTFRMIYGGAEHEGLRLPALGGSLFDPDRFPFLEGRAPGTNWKDEPANPLPIDNQTVLLLLRSLQVLQQKGGAQMLSYKGLDVEQIGHVYEGLLEYTVDRVDELSIGFTGSKNVTNPIVPVSELLDLDEAKLAKKLVDETGKTVSVIKNALKKEPEESALPVLIQALGNDEKSARKLLSLAGLIRRDSWGTLMVYPTNSFAVVPGEGRRATGAHYTPAELARDIVEKTLTPLIYEGPAEGWPKEQWKLRPSAELLDLKVCDPAMGSAAFLVAVCRYLSEKLITAWKTEEDIGKEISVDGQALESGSGTELMPKELDDRLLIARRLVAERCIYGVDINPMAVELAKLSIWLVTLQKGRPFGFLDHNLRSGDALLGLHKLDQLTKLSMHPKAEDQSLIFGQNIKNAVEEAMEVRKQLRKVTIRDVHDVEKMAELNAEAKSKLVPIELLADAMIGEALVCGGKENKLKAALEQLSTRADGILGLNKEAVEEIKNQTMINLSVDQASGKAPRNPFHWALEFPEVFRQGGLDAIVGNPPFLGGRQIFDSLGEANISFFKCSYSDFQGTADLVCYFFRRSEAVLGKKASMGLLTTNSISDTNNRLFALDALIERDMQIVNAKSPVEWPGVANIDVAQISFYRGKWTGKYTLNNAAICHIPTSLSIDFDASLVRRLKPLIKYSEGTKLYGKAFVKTKDQIIEARNLNPGLESYVRPYVNGDVLNGKSPSSDSNLYVIDFGENEKREIAGCDQMIEELSKAVTEERKNQKRQIHEHRPWLHWDKRTKFYNLARRKGRVIGCVIVSTHMIFHFVDPNKCFAHGIKLFLDDRASTLGALQSSFHYWWVASVSSTFRSYIRYSTSSSFDTYPIPDDDHKLSALNEVGDRIHQGRTKIADDLDVGLTQLYNDFHEPTSLSRGIEELRNLHVQLDNILASVYGWDGLDLGHGFHETKQGVRYTISEEARREVLQRLLKLNHERYEEEVDQGLHDKKKSKAKAEKSSEGQTELF